MPGAVPRTSTYALSNATLASVLKLARQGITSALRSDAALAKGLNTYRGHVTYRSVAGAFGLDCTPAEELLS
jgi:alanine dehydrogenase